MGSKRHIEFIARGVLIRKNHVLLCRAPGGYHYLPGGHIEFGESAAAALAREMVEETGCTIKVGAPLLTMEQSFGSGKKQHHEFNVVFHVEQIGSGDDEGGFPVVESQEPDLGFDWIDLAALPETDLRPIEMKAWLAAGGQPGGAETHGLCWVSGGFEESATLASTDT